MHYVIPWKEWNSLIIKAFSYFYHMTTILLHGVSFFELDRIQLA